MRTIDADKLMDALDVFSDREHADPMWMACLESVKEIITFMPDASVTYCKDCDFYEYDKLEERAYCCLVPINPDDICYCGLAERKEHEAD